MDKTNVSDVRAVDELRFNEMVGAYSPRLLAIASYLSKDRQVAEDIVQDAFLKLWESRTTIGTQNIGGWLYKVVVHAAYKYLNRQAKRQDLSPHKQHSCAGVEEYLVHKQGLEIFHNVYDSLPTQQRQVYRLAHQEDLSRHEIADRLKISPNTVKNHLTKATQLIRAQLTHACLGLAAIALINLFLEGTSTNRHPGDLYKASTIIKKRSLYDPENREPFPQVYQYLGNTGY